MSALEPIRQVRGRAVVVPGDDIDTDRIVPARFLRCITFDALADQLFFDERFDEEGRSKGHPLDRPGAADARILVSGDNFGCGSSREHAPQAIHKAGFRAIVAGSFADIFFGNATTLGVACLALEPSDLAALRELLGAEPDLELIVDVEGRRVLAGEAVFPAHVPDSAHGALIEGRWDPLAELLKGADEAVEAARDLGYA